MKFILMYTIEDEAHRELFYEKIRELYGDEYISEAKSLDQSSYGLPGDVFKDVYFELREICTNIYKDLKEFNRADKIDLYFAVNPKNNEDDCCNIVKMDMLKGLRRRSLFDKIR